MKHSFPYQYVTYSMKWNQGPNGCSIYYNSYSFSQQNNAITSFQSLSILCHAEMELQVPATCTIQNEESMYEMSKALTAAFALQWGEVIPWCGVADQSTDNQSTRLYRIWYLR